MTTQEILDAIERRTGQSNLDNTTILEDINIEAKRLNESVRLLDPRFYESYKTITLSSGTSEYDIEDTNFDRIKYVKENTTDKEYQELPVTSENSDFLGYYLSSLNGSTGYQQIVFTPEPSATDTRYLSYFTKFTELSESLLTATPNLPTDLHMALVFWGLVSHYGSPTVRDDATAAKFQSMAKNVEIQFFRRFNKPNKESITINIIDEY